MEKEILLNELFPINCLVETINSSFPGDGDECEYSTGIRGKVIGYYQNKKRVCISLGTEENFKRVYYEHLKKID